MISAAATLAGIGLYLMLPIRTSAVQNAEWTSPVPSITQPRNEPRPLKQLTSGIEPTKPAKLKESQASPLDATIEKWKQTLSKEKDFETWQKATWTSSPLGPGTHGWVILITKDSKELGYMIVYAAENGGFRLAEYGNGSNPLFSLNTLYRTLVQLELIPASTTLLHFTKNPAVHIERWYSDAMQAVWQITVKQQNYMIDAKTGEVLPIAKLPSAYKEGQSSQSPSELNGVIEQLQVPSFDPYERLPWVTGKPLTIRTLSDLKAALKEHKQLTYVAVLYDDQVTIPFAVLGYSKWDKEEPYVLLDQAGTRYISMSSLLQAGHFYP